MEDISLSKEKIMDINTSSMHNREKAIEIAQNSRFVVDPNSKDCVRATFLNCTIEYHFGWFASFDLTSPLNSTPDKSKFAGIKKAISSIGEHLIEKKLIPKSDRSSLTSRIHPTDEGLPELANSLEKYFNDVEARYNQRFIAPNKPQSDNGPTAPPNPK